MQSNLCLYLLYVLFLRSPFCLFSTVWIPLAKKTSVCACSRVAHRLSFSSRRPCWPWRSLRSCYTLHYCAVSPLHYISTGPRSTRWTRWTRRSLFTFRSRIAKSCSALRKGDKQEWTGCACDKKVNLWKSSWMFVHAAATENPTNHQSPITKHQSILTNQNWEFSFC